jgi:hypothetical protein
MAKTYKTWIYHATNEPKIINSDEFKGYSDDGWSDTPATFAKIKDFGIDEEDPSAVQVLGEAIEGVKNRINGELNISVMKKRELEDYAREHFNVELDCRRNLKTLRAEVKVLIEG